MIEEQTGGGLHARDDREILQSGDAESFPLLMTYNF
jgi:hypothetical protein